MTTGDGRREIERRARELENLRRAAENEARQQARAEAAGRRNDSAEATRFAPETEGSEPPRDGAASETAPKPGIKMCPQCAEEVKAAARLCRFCRYEFEPHSTEIDGKRRTNVPRTRRPEQPTAASRRVAAPKSVPALKRAKAVTADAGAGGGPAGQVTLADLKAARRAGHLERDEFEALKDELLGEGLDGAASSVPLWQSADNTQFGARTGTPHPTRRRILSIGLVGLMMFGLVSGAYFIVSTVTAVTAEKCQQDSYYPNHEAECTRQYEELCPAPDNLEVPYDVRARCVDNWFPSLQATLVKALYLVDASATPRPEPTTPPEPPPVLISLEAFDLHTGGSQVLLTPLLQEMSAAIDSGDRSAMSDAGKVISTWAADEDRWLASVASPGCLLGAFNRYQSAVTSVRRLGVNLSIGDFAQASKDASSTSDALRGASDALTKARTSCQ